VDMIVANANMFRGARGTYLVLGQTVLLSAAVVYLQGDDAFITKPSGVKTFSIVYFIAYVIAKGRRIQFKCSH